MTRSAEERQRSNALIRNYTLPAVTILILLVSWSLLRSASILPKSVPSPISVLNSLISDVQHPFLWSSIGSTLAAWVSGIVIVTVLAVPLGIALGSSRILTGLIQIPLEFLRTIPSIAAIPLLILIYGSGTDMAIVMVVLGAIWPLLIMSMYGVRDVDPVTRQVARAYGLNGRARFVRVVIPSSLPYIFLGLRLATSIGLILAVSASLVAGGAGLGAAISSASTADNTPLMYARVLLTGVLGLILTVGFRIAERRVLFWHQSIRKDAL